MQMQAKYAERGLVVVGITRDTPERTAWFADYLDASYPLLARAETTFEDFGVRWVPELYLVDPEGRVVADELQEIEARVARELGGSSN